MASPYHGLRPPFRLPSDVVHFHDWRHVDHGSTSGPTNATRSSGACAAMSGPNRPRYTKTAPAYLFQKIR